MAPLLTSSSRSPSSYPLTRPTSQRFMPWPAELRVDPDETQPSLPVQLNFRDWQAVGIRDWEGVPHEEVARVYYDHFCYAMFLEPVLRPQFDKAASQCLTTDVHAASVEGCSYGVTRAHIYLAEALISKGTYLHLLTISIGSQLTSFIRRMAKVISSNDGSFSYPTNPDALVLNNMSMRVVDGDIVGGSGCGWSTVASLLARLYEPTSRTIPVGLNELRATDINYLRDHVAVSAIAPTSSTPASAKTSPSRNERPERQT
ncbi:hypothetical protein DFH29DRAFT_1006447 [Suillus ampliporus]|nr:hypothetical protein DFH29DRAFT_1006447 [Suillus ampliporus]